MRRDRWRWALIVAAIVAVPTLAFLLAIPGQRWDRSEVENLPIELETEQIQDLRAELQHTLEQARESWETQGEIEPERIADLEAAIRHQRALILALRPHMSGADQTALRSDRERLNALRKLRDQGQGQRLADQSHALEAEAKRLRAAGDIEAALPRLEQALELQERIDNQYAGSDARNKERSQSLTFRVNEWQMEPELERLAALQAQAQEAIEAEDFDQALRDLHSALSYRRRLNR